MANAMELHGATPILHRKKADLAYEYLREQVVNGSFAPGQRITLAEMSSACGMSQMPVREALLRLQSDGLLESEPHKGMRVAELSLKDARELFAIRTELEGLAAFSACAAADAALVGDLKQINDRFSQALVITDYTAMGAANWAFHQRILKAAGNAQLDRLLTDLWAASQRYRMGYKLIPGRAQRTVKEHARMIVAIATGDPEQARQAAREHILRAGAELAVTVAVAQKAGTP